MADNHPIGLFDSGVGGLSVLAEIKKILPKESFIFLADQGHNPYGQKTKNQLRLLSLRITKFLLQHDIKLLVIACNTATCYGVDFLRSKFTIPIIGVVPAIRPANTLSSNKKIVVMSTPATAKSAYLSSLIKNFAAKTTILKLGCEGLEEAIEYLNKKNIAKLLDKYTNIIKKFKADVIVLGCTHHPFLKKEIQKRVGHGVKIIDSGSAIAKRVKDILDKKDLLAQKKSSDLFFTTGDEKIFSKVASTLLQYKVVGQKACLPTGRPESEL